MKKKKPNFKESAESITALQAAFGLEADCQPLRKILYKQLLLCPVNRSEYRLVSSKELCGCFMDTSNTFKYIITPTTLLGIIT